MASSPAQGELRRELGVGGAVMMGLGSIVGTGVFVSIGVAAGITGPSVVLATALAALVAMCNAFSSAQLAANYPVSGGTYEYGYRLLTPALGFTAGLMFLCAKSASAATAALGFSGYALHALDQGDGWLIPVAIAAVVVLTLIVLAGIRRSSHANIIIVAVTLAALLLFVLAGLANVRAEAFQPFFKGAVQPGRATTQFLEAAALMFVAYTGYGRIATLGEEVRDPSRTIPKAITLTLIVSALLYISVGATAVGVLGAEGLSQAAAGDAAPLEIAAGAMHWPWVRWAVAAGAVTAMLGVLLNLILGLSRVLVAMGRRGDASAVFARLDASGTTPYAAVLFVGVVIALLAAVGSVRLTWSFSAFTVLIYYALTNLSALRLARDQRLYSPLFPWGGLIGCLGLAFWVEPRIWLTGLAIIAAGLTTRAVYRAFGNRKDTN